METTARITIDRAAFGWPAGPWDDEPDEALWTDAATGLPCMALRHHLGHWCGYVGLPPEHPLYGKGYSNEGMVFEVHGDLTFAGRIKLINEPNNNWWLGFDCAHYCDFSPNDVKNAADRGYPFEILPDQQYRTQAYVQEQCAKLAAQVS